MPTREARSVDGFRPPLRFDLVAEGFWRDAGIVDGAVIIPFVLLTRLPSDGKNDR